MSHCLCHTLTWSPFIQQASAYMTHHSNFLTQKSVTGMSNKLLDLEEIKTFFI